MATIFILIAKIDNDLQNGTQTSAQLWFWLDFADSQLVPRMFNIYSENLFRINFINAFQETFLITMIRYVYSRSTFERPCSLLTDIQKYLYMNIWFLRNRKKTHRNNNNNNIILIFTNGGKCHIHRLSIYTCMKKIDTYSQGWW